jgi:uncharacterized protein (DUF362 family)
MISIQHSPSAAYPDSDDQYCPEERYPEYRFDRLSRRPNPVYRMVRDLLRQLGLDADHFGSSTWNPLGAYIDRGSSVFVLCNFVYHRRPQEGHAEMQAKCIHGSVLRAIVDYVLIAAGPEGRVRFGNAPLQSCDWSKVLDETGATEVLRFYRGVGARVEAKDLRLLVLERDLLGRVKSVERRDESIDVVDIDLGGESLLSDVRASSHDAPHFRVADYDPTRTESFHSGSSHRYLIHRAILDSDVVLSLSKLKTHEKVGITCGLKGFVGTVGHKDCLAHHRFGSARVGGDEYPESLRFLHPISKFQDWVNRRDPDAPLEGVMQIADRSLRRILKRVGIQMAGAWHGNDTCWRMALDLARLVFHADSKGHLHLQPQRRHISLIDGIVGGEGEGPLAPQSIASGVLVFSDDVALGDRIACRLMGFDPGRVPLVAQAFCPMSYPVTSASIDPVSVVFNGDIRSESDLGPIASRPFRPASGWRGHLGSGT